MIANFLIEEARNVASHDNSQNHLDKSKHMTEPLQETHGEINRQSSGN